MALVLELTLAVVVLVAELLLSFCSPQTLKQRRIVLLSTTIRIPFSSSPPLNKSLSLLSRHMRILHSSIRLTFFLGEGICLKNCDKSNFHIRGSEAAALAVVIGQRNAWETRAPGEKGVCFSRSILNAPGHLLLALWGWRQGRAIQ